MLIIEDVDVAAVTDDADADVTTGGIKRLGRKHGCFLIGCCCCCCCCCCCDDERVSDVAVLEEL